MPELLPSNRHPLNQRAKELLQKAKADRDPDALYLVQLMKWPLDLGQANLKDQFRAQIESTVDVLMGMDPPKAMKWLLEGAHPDDQRLSLGDLDPNPSVAASNLLESVHSKLVARIPGYYP